MPIVIYQQSFHDCPFDAVDPNKTCYVWEDNNNVNAAQSAFGLLDLRTDDPTKYGWNFEPGRRMFGSRWVGHQVDQQLPRSVDRRLGHELSEPDLRLSVERSSNAEHVDRRWRRSTTRAKTSFCSPSTGVTRHCPATPGVNSSPDRRRRPPVRRRPGSTTSSATRRSSSRFTSERSSGEGASGSCNDTTLVPRPGTTRLGGWPLNTLAVASCAAICSRSDHQHLHQEGQEQQPGSPATDKR